MEFIAPVKTRKEGMGILRCFQQLRSYRKEIETWNWEEITFSSQVVPKGFLVGEKT